jgi:hypothetical protein
VSIECWWFHIPLAACAHGSTLAAPDWLRSSPPSPDMHSLDTALLLPARLPPQSRLRVLGCSCVGPGEHLPACPVCGKEAGTFLPDHSTRAVHGHIAQSCSCTHTDGRLCTSETALDVLHVNASMSFTGGEATATLMHAERTALL